MGFFKNKTIKTKHTKKPLPHLFPMPEGKDSQVFTLYLIQALFCLSFEEEFLYH